MICAKVDYPLLDQLALYEGNMFWMFRADPKHRRNGTTVGGPVTYANCGREPKTLNVTMQTVNISDEGGDELLHLYLSAFKPTTSEDDVAQLVREFLDMEDSPKVQKLVPKGKDLSTLSFVSFKVSVRPELKQVAFAHGT
ncbi:hypothetical protein pipiens_017047 [Culex pipiens pipiens]|uniref:Uncharacterized protein n=1 Tax=Culex pipiens pipiens TaxID=38569 RepID=A0ABD1CIJ7_CULPP